METYADAGKTLAENEVGAWGGALGRSFRFLDLVGLVADNTPSVDTNTIVGELMLTNARIRTVTVRMNIRLPSSFLRSA